MKKIINLIFDIFYFIFFYLGTYRAKLLSKNPKNYNKLRKLMRKKADLVLKVRKACKKENIEDIAIEWKRMFPFCDRLQKIIKIENKTAYIETHFNCPFRKSGNVYGCYLTMEFDRRLLEKIGGQFIVLKSQAEKGIKICEVVIRESGLSTDDLIHAHERNMKINK